MQKTATFLLSGILAAVISGCATMHKGAYQKIEIVSTPAGAHCKMYREGQGFLKAISTPGEKYIQRSDKPLTIVCSKEGFETTTLTESAWAEENQQGSVNNIANLGFGFLIDESNKARYGVSDRFEIKLKKL